MRTGISIINRYKPNALASLVLMFGVFYSLLVVTNKSPVIGVLWFFVFVFIGWVFRDNFIIGFHNSDYNDHIIVIPNGDRHEILRGVYFRSNSKRIKKGFALNYNGEIQDSRGLTNTPFTVHIMFVVIVRELLDMDDASLDRNLLEFEHSINQHELITMIDEKFNNTFSEFEFNTKQGFLNIIEGSINDFTKKYPFVSIKVDAKI